MKNKTHKKNPIPKKINLKKNREKTRKNKSKNKPKTKTKNKKYKYDFNKTHYSSGDGMLTSVWGPSLWHFLHVMSFNYPINPTPEDKKNYKSFMKLLTKILPCKYCRDNLVKNYKILPLNKDTFQSRETFSKFVYTLHEHVNKMLGKTSNLCYKDVKYRYEHFRARCGKPKNNNQNTDKTKKNIKINTKSKTQKKEKGCTDPLNGQKTKCILNIVPAKKKCKTFTMSI